MWKFPSLMFCVGVSIGVSVVYDPPVWNPSPGEPPENEGMGVRVRDVCWRGEDSIYLRIRARDVMYDVTCTTNECSGALVQLDWIEDGRADSMFSLAPIAGAKWLHDPLADHIVWGRHRFSIDGDEVRYYEDDVQEDWTVCSPRL